MDDDFDDEQSVIRQGLIKVNEEIRFRNYTPQTGFLESMVVTVEKAKPSTIRHHIEDKLALAEDDANNKEENNDGNKYRIDPEMMDLKKVDYDLKRRIERKLEKLERETRKQIDKHIKEQRAANKRSA